ncbi:MAG: ComF family protein [Firmicutes bacterium]|nr:ComF family protein [Bacillota bacterium]
MFKTLSKMLFPEGIKCIICDGELDAERFGGVCARCELKQNDRFCDKCGRALKTQAKYCAPCQSVRQNFEVVRAPFVYEGEVKHLIYRLKYGNNRFLAQYMAQFMAKTAVDSELTADFIAFVPLFPCKKKRRGYNQAELLAKEVGRLTDVPVADVLDKVKETKNTARMRKYQRIDLLKNSLAVIPGIDFAGKAVLLVDDVFTTGTTANECAGLLLAAGAERVSVLTFATSKAFIKVADMDFAGTLKQEKGKRKKSIFDKRGKLL